MSSSNGYNSNVPLNDLGEWPELHSTRKTFLKVNANEHIKSHPPEIEVAIGGELSNTANSNPTDAQANHTMALKNNDGEPFVGMEGVEQPTSVDP